MMPRREEFFVCPNCEGKVARHRQSCPHCGSDENTGWAEDANKWESDIPDGYNTDDGFDYEGYLAEEFPAEAGIRSRPARRRIGKWVICALLCIGLLWLMLR